MQLSKQSFIRQRRFHGYHCPDGNTHIKNGGSFKKYSKVTPTIHINSNSYSFRIMFIMIIIRFFIICFINPGKFCNQPLNEILTQVPINSHFLTEFNRLLTDLFLYIFLYVFKNLILPFSLIYSIFVCFCENKFCHIIFFFQILTKTENYRLKYRLHNLPGNRCKYEKVATN